MKKQTFYKIWQTVEQQHPNIFYDTSKEDFYKQANITALKLEFLSEHNVAKEMHRLFAMLKDPQTKFNSLAHDKINYHVPATIKKLGEDYYIIDSTNKEIKFSKVLKVNGIKISKLEKKLKPFVTYESEVLAQVKINKMLTNSYWLSFVKNKNRDKISYVLQKDNKKTKTELNILVKDAKKTPKNYEFKVLKDILYISYNYCEELADYPLAAFVSDLKETVTNKNIIGVIVNLRENNGGNNKLFKVIYDFLKELNLPGVALISGRTFSAGIWALKDCLKLKYKMAGTIAGGVVRRFGEAKTFDIDGYSITVATKLYDDKRIFHSNFAIEPHYYIQNSISDYMNNKDVVLDYAKNIIKYVNKTKVKNNAVK